MAEGMQQATEEHGPEEQASTEGACRLTIADAGPRLKALNDAWDEIARLRITPEERAAIEGLMMGGCEPPEGVLNAEIDAVRGLLARHA